MLGALIQIAGLAVSVFVGLIFMIAGIDKLRHRALLPGVIANYRLLPPMLVHPAAWLLPFAEMLIGGGLMVGNRPAAVAAMVLLLVFAAAMAISIQRGRRHIDCGCGHAGLRQTLSWPLVTRNLALASALALRLVGDGQAAAADLAVGALAGLTAFLLMQMMGAIRALPKSQLRRQQG